MCPQPLVLITAAMVLPLYLGLVFISPTTVFPARSPEQALRKPLRPLPADPDTDSPEPRQVCRGPLERASSS